MRRLALLTLLLLPTALWAALSAGSAKAEGQSLRLLVGYAAGSTTDFAARLVAPPLEKALGHPVAVENVAGDNGFPSVIAITRAAPDGSTLVVADTLTLSLNQVSGKRDIDVTRLTPVAKISLGVSVAMIARKDSRIRDWASYEAALAAGPVTVCVPGRMSAFGTARSLVERATGTVMKHVKVDANSEALHCVADGRADVGLVATHSIDVFNGESGDVVRPVITFGAKRSPRFPGTPTLAEVTDDRRNDFTVAISVFGPPGMAADTVDRLSHAFEEAVQDPAAVQDAAAHSFPLHYGGPGEVTLTLERDMRVAKRIADWLDRP